MPSLSIPLPFSIACAADSADERARGARRDRQAWRTARAGLLSKLVNVGLRFVTIPLSLRLLGRDRYGLWLTVSSMLTWLAVYDLGLSSGLLNAAGEAYGRQDSPAIRRYVSTAFIGFTVMSLAMAGIVIAGSRWPGLPGLLGIPPHSPLAADARALVLLCGFAFAAAFTLNSVNHFTGALQEGYLAAYAQTSGALLSAVLLAGLSLRGASTLEFAAVMAVPGLLASGALAGYVFFVRHPLFRPRFTYASLSALRTISGYGTPIFLAQFADLAILYTANLLIANRLGPAFVPAYTVPATAFIVAGTVCYLLVTPYQAAYAEARALGDRDWIRRTAFHALFRNMALAALAGAGLIAIGPAAVRWWTRGQVAPDRSLLLALAVYLLATVWTMTNGILLIGIGRVKTKALLQGLVAAVHVIGAWLLLPHLGLIAVPIAGTLGYLIDIPLSLPLALRSLND